MGKRKARTRWSIEAVFSSVLAAMSIQDCANDATGRLVLTQTAGDLVGLVERPVFFETSIFLWTKNPHTVLFCILLFYRVLSSLDGHFSFYYSVKN